MARSRTQLQVTADVELTVDRQPDGSLLVASSDGRLSLTVAPADDLAIGLLVTRPADSQKAEGRDDGVPDLGGGQDGGIAAPGVAAEEHLPS